MADQTDRQTESTTINLANIPVSWSRDTWYNVMQTICVRLNHVLHASTHSTYNNLFSLMFPCGKNDPIDMFSIDSSNSFFLTNLCGLLNGIFAFRDAHRHTYRITPVFCETKVGKEISHFVVTVRPSVDEDKVFPLIED